MTTAHTQIVISVRDLASSSFRRASLEVERLKSEVFSLRGAFYAIGAGKAASELFEAGRAAESLDVAYKAIFKSTQAARQEMAWLRDISDELGQNFWVLADGYKRVAAAAMQTEMAGSETRDLFVSITEAMAALQLQSQDTHWVLYAFSQILSKGKLSAEELRRQLAERLPGAFQIAARSLGMTTQELDEALKKGAVDAVDFLRKFKDALHEAYGASAREAADKSTAALNKFHEALKDMGVTLSEGGFLTEASRSMREFADELKDPAMQAALTDIGAGLGGVVEAVAGPGLEALGGFARVLGVIGDTFSALPPELRSGLLGAGVGFKLAGPWGAAVGGLGSAMLSFGRSFERWTGDVQAQAKAVQEAQEVWGRAKAEVRGLAVALEDYDREVVAAAGDQHQERDAVEKLAAKYPDLVGQYNSVAQAMANIAQAREKMLADSDTELAAKQAAALQSARDYLETLQDSSALHDIEKSLQPLSRVDWFGDLFVWDSQIERAQNTILSLSKTYADLQRVIAQTPFGEARTALEEAARGMEGIIERLNAPEMIERLKGRLDKDVIGVLTKLWQAIQAGRGDAAYLQEAFAGIADEAGKAGEAISSLTAQDRKAADFFSGLAGEIAKARAELAELNGDSGGKWASLEAAALNDYAKAISSKDFGALPFDQQAEAIEEAQRLLNVKLAVIGKKRTAEAKKQADERLQAEEKVLDEIAAAHKAVREQMARDQAAAGAEAEQIAKKRADLAREAAEAVAKEEGYLTEFKLAELAKRQAYEREYYGDIEGLAALHRAEREALMRSMIQDHKGFLQRMLSDWTDMNKIMETGLQGTVEGIQDLWFGFLDEGKAGFDDFAEAVGDSAKRMGAQIAAALTISGLASLAGLVVPGLGKLFGAGGGGQASSGSYDDFLAALGMGDSVKEAMEASGFKAGGGLDTGLGGLADISMFKDFAAALQMGDTIPEALLASGLADALGGVGGGIAAQLLGPEIFKGFDSGIAGLGSAAGGLLAGALMPAAIASGPFAPLVIAGGAFLGGMAGGGLFADDNAAEEAQRKERAARIQKRLAEIQGEIGAIDQAEWLRLMVEAQETDAWMLDRQATADMAKELRLAGRADWTTRGIGDVGAAGASDRRGMMEFLLFGKGSEGHEGDFGLASWFGGQGEGAWNGQWDRVKEVLGGLGDDTLDRLGDAFSGLQDRASEFGFTLEELFGDIELSKLATGEWADVIRDKLSPAALQAKLVDEARAEGLNYYEIAGMKVEQALEGLVGDFSIGGTEEEDRWAEALINAKAEQGNFATMMEEYEDILERLRTDKSLDIDATKEMGARARELREQLGMGESETALLRQEMEKTFTTMSEDFIPALKDMTKEFVEAAKALAGLDTDGPGGEVHHTGGPVGRWHTGGPFYTPTYKSLAAIAAGEVWGILKPDEWVIKADSARMYGDANMAAINEGRVPPEVIAAGANGELPAWVMQAQAPAVSVEVAQGDGGGDVWQISFNGPINAQDPEAAADELAGLLAERMRQHKPVRPVRAARGHRRRI